ncbi:MAG: SDR family oxidoreductase [Bacteroidetes bacterium]|nr:SDR family oxidoreductase [Bacteroidota bacterium]
MKCILITGANKGIGFEIARQLSKLGHRVIISGRDNTRLNEAKQKFIEENLTVEHLIMDVGDSHGISAAAEVLRKKNIQLDVLINNAAILLKTDQHILQDDGEILQQTLNINSIGPLRVCKAFLPLIADRGRIINISSGGGSMTDPVGGWSPAYCVSKTFLNSITRQLAYELSSRQISVNAMCPGWVKTDMGGRSAPRTVQQGADTAVWLATAEKIPTGKFFRDRKEIPW